MDGEDLETSLLIAQFALEDINSVLLARKGKSREDAPQSDEEYALMLQAETLRNMIRSYEDYKVAQSIGSALETDQVFLDVAAVSEQGAADDRATALAIEGDQGLPQQTAAQKLLEVLAVSPPQELEPSPVVQDTRSLNPIEPGPSRAARNRSERVECTSCGDRHGANSSLRAPCGHFYCTQCLTDLAMACTRDESLFPLRCCGQDLPMASVHPLLHTKALTLFLQKSREFGTLASNRVYCPQPSCSTFLGSSENSNTDIVCRCGVSVCTMCKQRSHRGDTCTQNIAFEEVKVLAKESGWQTCPGCHAIIELHQGCYHMTCRCRTQFCYLCAVPWKGCACPQWEEARLLDTAERRVENELGDWARDVEPALFQGRVDQVVEDLRVNHDCEGHRWRSRGGGGRCEECHAYLGQFLMCCRGCGLLVCRRCARNRL